MLSKVRRAVVKRRTQRYMRSGVLTMGRKTYGDPLVTSWNVNGGVVRVGSFCSIGSGVQFQTGGNHRPDWITTSPIRILYGLPGAFQDGHPATRGDIEIGHDVWIGSDALILSGVTIGHGAVIGSRAVVTKDVRPYAVVVGNPGREVRRRFDDETVERLLRLAWWDWPDTKIVQSAAWLCSPPADDLRDPEINFGD